MNSDTFRTAPSFWPRSGLLGLLLLLLAAWALWPFAIVPAGHRGVMTTLGKPSDVVYDEGIHLRLPVLQKLHPMDVRVARSEGEGDAASKDLQAVRVKVILNYHLDPRAVAQAFRLIAPTTEEVAVRIVEPARPEAFKAVTAQLHRRGAGDAGAARSANALRRSCAASSPATDWCSTSSRSPTLPSRRPSPAPSRPRSTPNRRSSKPTATCCASRSKPNSASPAPAPRRKRCVCSARR